MNTRGLSGWPTQNISSVKELFINFFNGASRETMLRGHTTYSHLIFLLSQIYSIANVSIVKEAGLIIKEF